MAGQMTASDGARRAAVIVVHGIGNQAPGHAATRLAEALNETGTPGVADGDPPVVSTTIAGLPVEVCEAYWASHSSPDNPPVVRNALGMLRELVKSAMDGLSLAVRPEAEQNGRAGAAEVIYLFAVALFVVLPYIAGYMSKAVDNAMGCVFFLVVAALIVHSIWYVVKRRRLVGSGRGRAKLARWAGDALAMIFRPSIVVVATVAAVLLLAMTVIAVPVNLIGMALAWPFRALGWLLSRARLTWVARWVHRLGWVLVVLPVNSYLMAVKAFVTLTSIAITEVAVGVRLRALFRFPAIVLALTVLMLVCQALIIPPVVLAIVGVEEALADPATLALTIIVMMIIFAVYLLLIRVLLPVLDILLDVSNYHLASDGERAGYFARLDRAVDGLAEAGCDQFHLLAHSLGTVIVFDWLKQRAQGERPVIASLHTIGSPLEKFWFVDHTGEQRRDTSGLEGHVSTRWINYWALSDPVSGFLKRFNGPKLVVTNQRLPWLGAFLLSHTAYWKRPEVLAGVLEDLHATAGSAGVSEPLGDPVEGSS